MVSRNSSNKYISATTANEVTMPAQPAFLTTLAANRDNVTGNNTQYTVVWGSEIYDQNADFDNTSTFTAPVTGKIILESHILYSGLAAANDTGRVYIVTSNRTFDGTNTAPYIRRDAGGQFTGNCYALTDVDSGDTASVVVLINGVSKVVDIITIDATDGRSWFSGTMLC